MSSNNILSTILERTTTRSFSKTEIPQETILNLLQAAMAAPTACDTRPWSFVVITQKETIEQLADVLRHGKHAENASAIIVVCGLSSTFMPEPAEDYWIQDCAAATQNILIAAQGHNLHSAWIGLHPTLDQQSAVNGVLGIPRDVIPFSLVCVGASTECAQQPKDKFDITRIHWELW